MANEESKARFGSFGGVFVPNVLTIIGLVFFLRTGWVVGQVGMWQALLIVAIANLISLLTGLSLSAVASSMNVRTGGAYFILTRTLGVEVGGAIGIPLYLSQAVSIAFYVIGFTTSLRVLFPELVPYEQWIATGVVLFFGTLSFIGADFAIKIQYLILGVLAASVIAFFAGGWDAPWDPILSASDGAVAATTTGEVAKALAEPQGFWIVFAVFFPAVTGIMVGASMSGDLKNPGRAIPKGTLLSISITGVVYVLAVIWIAGKATREELLTNEMIMQDIAAFPEFKLIVAGIWAATLSSALGSVLAAPRTLQALAMDRVLPRVFSHQMGSKTEPRLAVLVSTTIGVGIVWAGGLNFVAEIITMFFLATYGTMNLAAGIEKLVGNPSYRPRFNLPWYLSALGALGCFAAMLLINVPATLVVIAVISIAFLVLQRRSIQSEWGDVRSGIWFAVARHSLLKLEGTESQPKNWRPNVIVFTGQPRNREHLVEIGDWLSKGQGIVTFFQILVGNQKELAEGGVRDNARKHIQQYIRDRRVHAFAECEIAKTFYDGAVAVVQTHGIAGLEPNAILMGLSETPDGLFAQHELVQTMAALGKSSLLQRYDKKRGYGDRKIIDVWWGGRSRNAELMLMLAHIVTGHPSWSGARVRLLQVVDAETGVDPTKKRLRKLLEAVRVRAEPVTPVRVKGEAVSNVIARTSGDTDLTILGFSSDVEDAARLAEHVAEMTSRLGSVMLVNSAEKADVLDHEGVAAKTRGPQSK